ncbi:hypothetical protein L7F22_001514 [Adiantum nelumboides]|nr:hypothetical protein [Adiantum nelumboides]
MFPLLGYFEKSSFQYPVDVWFVFRLLRFLQFLLRLFFLCQVKSSQWIADGLRELVKDMEVPSCSLGTTGNIHKSLADELDLSAGMSSQLVDKIPFNLATQKPLLIVDNLAQPSDISNVPVDNGLSSFLAETRFVFSPMHYVRRKRTKQQKEENDLPWIDFGVVACPIDVQ